MTGEEVREKEESDMQVGRGSGKATMFMGGQGSAKRIDCTGRGDTTLSHATYVQPAATFGAPCDQTPPDVHVYTTC